MSVPLLNVLNPVEIEAIHNATLRILSEVGILLNQPEARDLLFSAGARFKDQRLTIPPDLVEWALAQCPATVSIRGRGGKTATLGDGSLHWHNLGGAREVYEPDSHQVRPAAVADVIQAARLLDALENCTCITPFFTPQDVPGETMSLAMYRHTLPHTTKPVYGPGVQTAGEVQLAARMAEVIGPPPETMIMAISPISPLTFPDHLVEAMLETARHGIPFGPLPCPTAGTTAPLSISGAIAQQNAEILASIVLVQLVRPGLPILYCGRLAMMDPRTGASVWGGIELGLASAGTVQIAHRYRLPVNVYGFSTNAHTLDLQNGYERALNAAIPALAGADELSGIGEMSAGVMSSYAQMVIDNEIAASILRLRRGFPSDADALAVEVIASAMETTRNFLIEDHTVRTLRSGELLVTRLAERGARPEGDILDSTLLRRAISEARQLIIDHDVPPLETAQEKTLDDILKFRNWE
jgi:trimethylamine---corrinoid protein Co-methyltransferase